MSDLRAAAVRYAQTRAIRDMFPAQRAFFDDPAKIKAAVCGRRSGKTWSCAVGLYDAARKRARTICPYIALTGKSARTIMWPVLVEANDKYQWGLQLREHELTAVLPNGSTIMCVGGDDARKVESLRGGKYGRVVLDEAGSLPRELARYLVEDVLDAALLDLDGDLWIVGTPNAACVGYFHDITTGSNPDVAKVSTHHWTVLDNTHIPHAARWLADKRKSKGWAEDHPVFRREYLGHWVRDASSLVFRFDRARHIVASVPPFTRSVLGGDIGASETKRTTAFVVNGWTQYDRKVRTSFAKKYGLLIPSELADEGKRISDTHGCTHVVLDPGGLGKGYIGEWRARHAKMAVLEAQKANKLAYIELLNGELDSGNVEILNSPDTRDLVDELELLQWNEDHTAADERFADHCADAWLYSWRDCYAWAEQNAPARGPEPGTVEALDAEMREHKRRIMQESLRKARANGRRILAGGMR